VFYVHVCVCVPVCSAFLSIPTDHAETTKLITLLTPFPFDMCIYILGTCTYRGRQTFLLACRMLKVYMDTDSPALVHSDAQSMCQTSRNLKESYKPSL